METEKQRRRKKLSLRLSLAYETVRPRLSRQADDSKQAQKCLVELGAIKIFSWKQFSI